jgi:hypothetical protein
MALIYLELALALTLLATVLHFRSLRKTRSESAAVRLYFVAFFILLLAVPLAVTVLSAARPREALASFGWTFGRAGLGVALTLASLPLTILAARSGSKDPAMQKMYPLAKAACADSRAFVRYELSYLFLYYLPWESVFRGLIFLPLVPVVGLVPALALQTAVSTLLHVGHPKKEILAAAVAGPGFGLVAYFTGSFFYTLFLHAAAGIATDTFLFRRRHP